MGKGGGLNRGGVILASILTIPLVVFKLLGTIDISWGLVFLPIVVAVIMWIIVWAAIKAIETIMD